MYIPAFEGKKPAVWLGMVGVADIRGVFTDYALFHEGALANATSVLQAQGKVKGSNVKPFSIQAFE